MKRVFFEFGSKWASNNRNKVKDFESYRDDFKISDKMVKELKTIIEKHEIEFSQKAFDKDYEYIALLMKAEIARHVWDREHYYMVRLTGDSEVQHAQNLITEAERIMNLHTWNGRQN